MDTRKIRKLIELVKETGIGELEVTSGDESVRISCQTSFPAPAALMQPVAAAPLAAAAPAATNGPEPAAAPVHDGHQLKSPMVGTAYLAPTPGAKPFVSVGQHIEVGDTLCLIEAMKMFNKIEADVAGVLSARLVENGTPVEYDQPLFIIDTGE
ncbi:MAG: acetyl-CoA carboxylase, biotin carboxyl carrier protein [Coxiella sp. (in: Bacteria)]|nr:MAG: acetyl-CoA carboxylase, biotin carboxyl carrier protein [Coxiella sp. (in: g-proteobacteria)]